MKQNIDNLLADLQVKGGCIVCSGDCSNVEIAFAESEHRLYVADSGIGFIRRTSEWLINSEAAIREAAKEDA